MPTFLPNKPAGTDQISVSQGDIQNNFQILGAIAGNMNPASSSINVTPGSGFNWLYLSTQGSTPPAAASFPSATVGMYSATSTTTASELYINKTNQATVVQVASTASILSSISSPGNLAGGWSLLPSGILIEWGTTTLGATTAGTYPINNTGGYPTFGQIFDVQITGMSNGSSDPNSAYYVTSVLTGGSTIFTLYQAPRSSGSVSFAKVQWVAIGIPATQI